jgi:hypothetical protein
VRVVENDVEHKEHHRGARRHDAARRHPQERRLRRATPGSNNEMARSLHVTIS